MTDIPQGPESPEEKLQKLAHLEDLLAQQGKTVDDLIRELEGQQAGPSPSEFEEQLDHFASQAQEVLETPAEVERKERMQQFLTEHAANHPLETYLRQGMSMYKALDEATKNGLMNEDGLVVVDKIPQKSSLDSNQLVAYFNQHSDIFYEHGAGDVMKAQDHMYVVRTTDDKLYSLTDDGTMLAWGPA